MAAQSIIATARKYLKALNKEGIPIRFGVLFGSQVKGSANRWSDIDLLVVSPRFDGDRQRSDISLLWRVAARTDSRIEPVAVGERQYAEDDSSAIVEIARREGRIVELKNHTVH